MRATITDTSISRCSTRARRRAGAGGIPQATRRDVLVARYNDLDSVDTICAGLEDELAAILVEPIAANMGVVMPAAGFLEGLRERARRWGALLIFDEVVTWLRFGMRGAQARTGVTPDLTALGKIMGGGVPIAAFGGREAVMAVLAPAGDTFTGGTHGGNPFSVGMAHRVLDLLEAHPEYYDEMRALAQRLAGGIREILARRGLPYAVVAHESIVDFKFRNGPPKRELRRRSCSPIAARTPITIARCSSAASCCRRRRTR